MYFRWNDCRRSEKCVFAECVLSGPYQINSFWDLIETELTDWQRVAWWHVHYSWVLSQASCSHSWSTIISVWMWPRQANIAWSTSATLRLAGVQLKNKASGLEVNLTLKAFRELLQLNYYICLVSLKVPWNENNVFLLLLSVLLSMS